MGRTQHFIFVAVGQGGGVQAGLGSNQPQGRVTAGTWGHRSHCVLITILRRGWDPATQAGSSCPGPFALRFLQGGQPQPLGRGSAFHGPSSNLSSHVNFPAGDCISLSFLEPRAPHSRPAARYETKSASESKLAKILD